MSLSAIILFYRRVQEDSRIAPVHISLYMALFTRGLEKGLEAPVLFRRRELMVSAKISGLATYHKTIRELSEYGYIRYIPSFNPALYNQVYILVASGTE